jgi:hypothetical protein
MIQFRIFEDLLLPKIKKKACYGHFWEDRTRIRTFQKI